MAANSSKTSEDAEMAECDGQKVVTMMDVLKEQEDFEEDANAVLGGSDDKNCTYSKGYVKRQAIYACLTCCPDASTDSTKRAGLCLACSLHCHENHELVELYTKRNFRCDCGNPKFTQPCTFTPNKTDVNYENKYNQNFSGLYCSCHRPYPDPEATEEEEMLQCIICEDWLHIDHLEATVPLNDQYAEMVCKDCMEDNDFLHDYCDMIVNTIDKEIIVTDPDLDVSSIIMKKKEEAKESLTNGISDAVINKDIKENGSEINDGKKDEATPDTEMAESKPNDGGEHDNKAVDSNDANSENKDSAEASANVTSENKGSSADDENQKDSIEGVEKKSEENLENSSANENNEDKPDKTETSDDKIASTEGEAESSTTKDDNDKAEVSNDKNTEDKDDIRSPNEKKRRLSSEGDSETSPKKQKLDPCIRPRGVKRVYKGATFWPYDLRTKLCSCGECLAMYKDLAVLFLIEPDDTVTAYEALGKENIDGPSSQYEKGLQALSSLDRIQQINALTEYNKMRDKLLDFLKSFKDRKEIVKEEDIKAFFAGMKPKREPDGVYFCR